MSKTKQIELINDAYNRLVWAVDNIDGTLRNRTSRY